MKSLNSRSLVPLFFAVVTLFGTRSFAECVGGQLGQLKSSSVFGHLSDLLQGNDLVAGNTYEWRIQGESKPFHIQIASAAPNTLFVKVDRKYVPIESICSDGRTTAISLTTDFGPAKIQLENNQGRFFSTVYLNNKIFKPRTELDPEVAVGGSGQPGQVATQRPPTQGRF